MPQPRSPTVQRRIEQRRQRVQRRGAAEQLPAQPIPLPRGRGEKLLRLASAAGRGRPLSRRASWSAPGVAGDLLAQQRPQPARVRVALVQRQRVVAAGAVAARRHPARVRQRLQVPADRRLRQLQHRAQLRDRQLVPLEDEQHPAAGRIRQRREVVENGRGIHPYIRINSLIQEPGRLSSCDNLEAADSRPPVTVPKRPPNPRRRRLHPLLDDDGPAAATVTSRCSGRSSTR